MPIVPPIFVRGDDLYIFRSVKDAESGLEPVDVGPAQRGFDAEGRLLHVLVRGDVKRRWFGIDQHVARFEVVLVEEQPSHAEDLRTTRADWLGKVEKAPDLATAPLAELLARAQKHVG